MKEDRLTYDELLKFNDEMIKDQKEFDEELRTRINKQKFIIVRTPTFDSSQFEKVYQSAREEGCGIAIFKPSNDNNIEHVPNQEAFGIAKATFKQISFIDDCYPYNMIQSTMQEQLCDALYEEQKLLKELPKKKKTFQENFGYVKRKFR